MSRGSKSLIAFLAGVAAGTAIGILYAPDKGKNTRDKLSFKLEKYKEQLQKLLDELVSGKKEVVSSAKSEGNKITTDAIKKAEELLTEIDMLSSQIKPKK